MISDKTVRTIVISSYCEAMAIVGKSINDCIVEVNKNSDRTFTIKLTYKVGDFHHSNGERGLDN